MKNYFKGFCKMYRRYKEIYMYKCIKLEVRDIKNKINRRKLIVNEFNLK